MSTWVCSKYSKDADKWEVLDDLGDEYEVKSKLDPRDAHFLPKSDYIPCEPPAPPERWEDITEQCEAGYRTFTGPSAVWNVSLKMPDKNEGYTFRLRKVQLTKIVPGMAESYARWAFIVEKKVTT